MMFFSNILKGKAKYEKGGMLFLCSIIILIYLTITLSAAFLKKHPGHADPSFYVSMAKQIANGDGLNINYLWNFLSKPEEVSHYAFDYWLPGTSLIQAGFIVVFDDSIFSITLASIFSVLMISTIGFLWCLLAYRSHEAGLIFLALFLSSPNIIEVSLSNETKAFQSLFVILSLCFIFLGGENKKFLVIASIFVALSNLVRSDGILLLIVLCGSCYFYYNIREGSWLVFFCIFVYLLAMLPLYTLNYYWTGYAMPPSFKSAFLTRYVDLFAFDVDRLNLGNYLDLGIGPLIWQKLVGLVHNIKITLNWPFSFVLAVYVFFVAFVRSQIRLKDDAPTIMYLSVIFLFYSFVVDKYQAGYEKTVFMVFAPLLILVSRRIAEHPSKSGKLLILGFYLASCLPLSVHSARQVVKRSDILAEKFSEVCSNIEEYLGEDIDKILVMTRNVWQWHESCGVRAIQVPSDGFEGFQMAYQKFEPEYLIVDENWIERRPYLHVTKNGIQGEIGFVEFQFVEELGEGVRLFQLGPSAGQPK